MPALLLAAALFAAPSFTAPASPIAAQQDRWRGVNGNNVTRVFHSGGGTFEQLENNRWVEFADDGTLIHEFEEQRRDYNSVSLLDRSRGGVRVEINFRTGEINGAPAFGSWRPLYRITDADSDRRGRGWRGRRGGDGSGPGRRDDRDGGYGNNDGWGRDGFRDVEVGPIWNQRDAEQKCRAKAAELRVEWTGQWHTTVVGRQSVCQMRRGGGGGYGNGGNNNGGYGNGGGRGVTRELEVGPIWNQRDAEAKCRTKANEVRGDWTGQWRTTVQGRMSVCEIRFR
jgi:hypothetical protein